MVSNILHPGYFNVHQSSVGHIFTSLCSYWGQTLILKPWPFLQILLQLWKNYLSGNLKRKRKNSITCNEYCDFPQQFIHKNKKQKYRLCVTFCAWTSHNDCLFCVMQVQEQSTSKTNVLIKPWLRLLYNNLFSCVSYFSQSSMYCRILENFTQPQRKIPPEYMT